MNAFDVLAPQDGRVSEARVARMKSLGLKIDNDLSEGRPYGRPHVATDARVFATGPRARVYAIGLRAANRILGRHRYSVRVYPRNLRVDQLSLPVWVVVQRSLDHEDRKKERSQQ